MLLLTFIIILLYNRSKTKNKNFKFICMKTLFVFLVCVFIFVSCNKEYDMVINVINYEDVKSELALRPALNKQEVIDSISSKSALKSANFGGVHLIEVFPLEQETFEIFDTYAIKNHVYYDLDSDSKRTELLTVMQRFEIKNNKLVTTSYRLDYKFACEFSREFSIDAGNAEVWDVICMFHFKNGSQFAYSFDGSPDRIKLPNIANGNWEIAVKTYDGDLQRNLTTGFINFNDAPDVLSLLIQPKATNVVKKFAINKEMLKDVYSIKFVGEDPMTGEEIWIYIPFRYNENLPGTVLFDLPFSPKLVVLISENSWDEYDLSDD